MRIKRMEAVHQLARPRQSLNAVLALLIGFGGILSAFVIRATPPAGRYESHSASSAAGCSRILG
jgi:hypothetical protein